MQKANNAKSSIQLGINKAQVENSNQNSNKEPAQLEKIIEIEICKNCSTHEWCTRHDEKKYQELFIEVKTAIEKLCPDVKVVQSKIANPRLGAFEVHHFKKNLFSKSNTGLWPAPSAIAQRVQMYFNDISQGNDVTHYGVQKEVMYSPPRKKIERPTFPNFSKTTPINSNHQSITTLNGSNSEKVLNETNKTNEKEESKNAHEQSQTQKQAENESEKTHIISENPKTTEQTESKPLGDSPQEINQVDINKAQLNKEKSHVEEVKSPENIQNTDNNTKQTEEKSPALGNSEPNEKPNDNQVDDRNDKNTQNSNPINEDSESKANKQEKSNEPNEKSENKPIEKKTEEEQNLTNNESIKSPKNVE